MATLLIKVECENENDVNEALERLVEERGASFYTLVRDGERVKVDEQDHHLLPERFEGALTVHAYEMFVTMLQANAHPPTQLVSDFAELVAWADDEEGRNLLNNYRTKGG